MVSMCFCSVLIIMYTFSFLKQNYLCTGEAASPAPHENTRFLEKLTFALQNTYIIFYRSDIVHIVSPPSACVSLVFFHDLSFSQSVGCSAPEHMITVRL